MRAIQDQFGPTLIDSDRLRSELGFFLVEVLSVDDAEKKLTVVSLDNGVTYQNVRVFPANHSSKESTDVQMPERGSQGIAVNLHSKHGFTEIGIVNWVVTDTSRAQQGVATRAIDSEDMQGWNVRTRGSYRPAAPGEHTVTNTAGFSEKHDDGWDRLAADFSRDHVDPIRRQWNETTSRKVRYNDSGVTMEGPVERPGAMGVASSVLPDGTKQAVVFLAPGAAQADRYLSGLKDVIALVERTEKIQEFALDYSVPEEIVGTVMLDEALGVTADAWQRTSIEVTGNVSHDDQTELIDQHWDHPTHSGSQAVGPTTEEGPTPRRRGYIIERSAGTLVGSNRFDPATYGHVLKPVVFPYTSAGRFAVDVESGYLPVNPSDDHVETRLAASAYSVRFSHESNTTRWDVTKEGFVSLEIGSTLPKENIPLTGGYEHPHGAGRSLEGHLNGSLKLVVGKNRDEEDAIDLQALGQTVLRLGADDGSLPNARRSVMTQTRSQNDAVVPRSLQYWNAPKLVPGDAGNFESKTGAENVSLRAALDGGTVIRFGARNPAARRRHIMNGYADGPGVTAWATNDPARKDSKTSGRPTYGAGDSLYAYHDLTQVGKAQQNLLPYAWSGAPVTDMDRHGLSLDAHLVRDALFRVGKNEESGQSLLLDTAGGLVAAIGKDNQGRSITASLDGGVELTIGPSKQGKALRVEFNGDVDWVVKGHFHLHVTGDSVFESASHTHVAKTDFTTKAQRHVSSSLVRDVTEAPDIVHNQGLYESDPNT
jgi:hypothetical protein